MRAIGSIAAICLLTMASAASATATIEAGSTSVLTAGGVGTTLTFNGQTDGLVHSGLTSSLNLSLLTQVGNVFTFGYQLFNTSTNPMTSARVTGFGFDLTPNNTAASILTGTVFDQADSGSISNGMNVEVCITTHNCSGGGGHGVTIGQNTSGSFALTFAGSPANVTLTDFIVRYQSLAGAGNAGSGVGISVNAVPEPATWAMMLLGFGAVGVAMRRRRRVALQAA
ncbi:MAG: cistern family PEP-CTERM protein [Sphingomonas bacterium]|nr:cistern family PEP-CTERM protein [Sphingomonas bacterium]